MPQRIVSLLPSATEIVCALGARHMLVGRSHECDFPDGVDELPILTRTRLSPLRSSVDIDRNVRAAVEHALSVYEIDAAQLSGLNPDLIVTQDLCDVCAVSFEDVCTVVRETVHSNVEIVRLHPERLSDIWSDIRQTGRALGCEGGTEALLQHLNQRVAAVRKRAEGVTSRPQVLMVEWLEPVMIGGLWTAELVEIGGGRPLASTTAVKAGILSRDQLAQLRPDVVMLKPCGFKLAQTLGEAHILSRVLPLDLWPAARHDRVYAVDGNAYFNRPGPRIVDSLEILAACLHPQLFPDFKMSYRDAVRRITAGLSYTDW
ncbi:MAG: ABC transporter substrate-binding protein [Gammaproteobacteria bacterium]|nr:ABC transporter substrate-binding protein [Gammaproteobacteria bacterium]